MCLLEIERERERESESHKAPLQRPFGPGVLTRLPAAPKCRESREDSRIVGMMIQVAVVPGDVSGMGMAEVTAPQILTGS